MIRAKYTVVLHTLMTDPQLKQQLDRALSTYPLYQKTSKEEFIPVYIPTREELNMKILNHYKYREIGCETIAQFLDRLEIAMNEIMPRYNQLFFSADQDFNVIWNVDYKRTIERQQDNSNQATGSSSDTSDVDTTTTAQDETTTTGTASSHNKHINSKTPQDKLSIGAEDINSIDYADEAQWNKDTSTTGGSSQSNGTTGATSQTKNTGTTSASGSSSENENTTETTKGNFGVVSAQDLILKFRETIRNIEKEIIEDPEIRTLFMLVY